MSPGCKFCYAENVAVRFSGPGQAYEGLASRETGLWTGKVRMVPEHLADPLRWKKPRRIFVNSMSDLFHEALSNEDIAAVFGVMAAAQQHTFQALTKRANRMRDWFRWAEEQRRIEGGWTPFIRRFCELNEDNRLHERIVEDGVARDPESMEPWPLPNVWLGVSVEDQERANERIPLLLDTPAAVRFLSVEPQLGAIDLHPWMLGDSVHRPADCLCGHGHGFTRCPNTGTIAAKCHVVGCDCPRFRKPNGVGIDWVIVGGESGHDARPFDLEWARIIIRHCQAAGVACFIKQLGAAPVGLVDRISHRWDKTPRANGFYRYLNSAKGGDTAEWPIDLRVQQFPGSGG